MAQPDAKPEQPSDEALLDAWRSGDAAAGEALFVRHYAPVSRFFRNKVAADRVADLIQETFMAVVEARERELVSFRAYLLRVAYYVFCRHIRTSYRRGPSEDIDELSLADVDASQTSMIAHAQEQRLLLEGLRAIPIKYQVVLELHYWEELTTNEIAEVLDIPPGTARSRLRRARDSLEAAMASIARSPALLESTMTRLDDWAAQCFRVGFREV